MTDKEKQLLTRFFLTGLKLTRSKKETTAKQYAEQMTNLLSQLIDERKS